MTVEDFKLLYDDVIEAYKKDLKSDKDHNVDYSDAQMFHLIERGPDSKYDISYYLVRNNQVRKVLIEYFKDKPNIKGADEVFRILETYKSNLSNPAVLEVLQEFLTPKYLYNKHLEAKDKADNYILRKMKHLCRIAYEAYRAKGNQTKFACYYYSTNEYRIKQFDLILDLSRKKAEVYHFHKEDTTEYKTEQLQLNKQLRVFNIDLYKDGNQEDKKLHLSLHKPEKNIENISILTGVFSGASILDGSPICSKVIFVNQSKTKQNVNKNTLLAKRHLNLYRKRIKVVRESILRDRREYKLKYDYELESLEDFRGTHIVGRFDRGGILLSVLRFYDDYSITLEHPMIRGGKPLICMLDITPIFGRMMHIRVLAGRKDTPVISFITSLSKEEGKFGDGAYCGITRYGAINGEVVLYKENNDPESQKIKPQRLTTEQLRDHKGELIKIIIDKLENMK